MRRASVLALTIGFACAGSAHADLVERGTFTSEETFPPMVITDLPCLEGTEFLLTDATESIRGNFIDFGDGFHFFQRETHTATATPLSNEGPTYVESGNSDFVSFNVRATSGVTTVTHVNNDNFLAIEDGHVVGSQIIRVHELEHITFLDTNGDGEPDDIKVEFSRPTLSCPA